MNKYYPKNILITGGAGFIGANFIQYMLKQYADIEVWNLDKLTYAGDLSNLDNFIDDPRYSFVQGDICNSELVYSLLKENDIDTIVHFAAESHVDRSISEPHIFIQTNIVGTYNLLTAAKKYWLEDSNKSEKECRFHHVSTDEVYGSLSPDEAGFNEETQYKPNSPYSASKASSDHLVRAFQHTFNLPTTISNCSNNYGPFQHQEKLIPTVIDACLNWRSIPVYGNGENIRDWLHVKDHCKAIDCILQNSEVDQVYNVGGKNELTNIQLVEIICDICDKLYPREKSHKALITYVKDRAGHDYRYAIDNGKIIKDLNWEPQMNFEQGLLELIKMQAEYINN